MQIPWVAYEGTWYVRRHWLFVDDVDWKKTIPMVLATSGSKKNLWRRLERQWSLVYNGDGDNDFDDDVNGGGNEEHCEDRIANYTPKI